MESETRKKMSDKVLHRDSFPWKKLDLSFKEEWKCVDDSTCYRGRGGNEAEKVFEFLVGLNSYLDNIRRRIPSK